MTTTFSRFKDFIRNKFLTYIAEVGVYRVGTAKIICKAKGSKKLHLFDTFEGLPDATINDDKEFVSKEKFYVFYEGFKNFLKKEICIKVP